MTTEQHLGKLRHTVVLTAAIGMMVEVNNVHV